LPPLPENLYAPLSSITENLKQAEFWYWKPCRTRKLWGRWWWWV